MKHNDSAIRGPAPLHSIQALRGLSALWVVLFHAQILQGSSASVALNQFAGFGYLGVDIFFVISGFIMAMTTAQLPSGWRTARQFSVLRMLRIYSGAWPVLGLCLIGITWSSGWPSDKHLWSSWFLTSLNIDTLLLPVTWTLTFELYFYLWIAVTLLLPAQRRPMMIAALAALVCALNLYWFSHNRYHPDALDISHWGMYLFSSPLCLEFLMGYGCYSLLQRTQISWRWWLAATLASGILVWVYATYFSPHPSGLTGFFHYPERAVLAGFFALSLLCLFIRVQTALPRRLSLWAGDISYMLYLVHLPVMWCFNTWHIGQTSTTRQLWTVLGCLVAASALHYLLEKPLYTRCRRLLQLQPQPRHTSSAYNHGI